MRWDVTGLVEPGGVATVSCRGLLNNSTPPDGAGNIMLQSWLIIHEQGGAGPYGVGGSPGSIKPAPTIAALTPDSPWRDRNPETTSANAAGR